MFQFPEFASYTLFYSGVDTLSQYLETCFVLTAQRPADGAAQKGRRALPYEGSPSKDQSLQNRFSRYLRWVSPFGYPWIKAYSQLPTAFRSVSRPSSPVHAKASTKCPYDT